jgi:microcystin-dependent protein
MATPFLGQLMLVSFNFAQKGFVMANGQLLPINQNQALFSLFGTTYGGDGRQTFGLPDLRGRTPIAFGTGFTLGQRGGEDAHTLTASEVPTHNHTINAAGGANLNKPLNALLAGGGGAVFVSPSNLVGMNSGTLTSAGGSQPHENRQPFLVMTWIISMQGIYPTRS